MAKKATTRRTKKDEPVTTEETTTDVAVRPETALATYDGYAEYAGEGLEGIDPKSIQIPFLNVCQSNSTKAKKSVEKGGFGAAEGDLFNSVSGEVYDGETGVGFVAAAIRHAFVEWVPRDEDKDGGFVREWDPADDVIQNIKKTQPFGAKYKIDRPDGGQNDLVDTQYLIGVMFDIETMEPLSPMIIPFSSTKMKNFNRLMSMISMFQIPVQTPAGQRRINPPLFAHPLRITTFDDENKKGEFKNVNITPLKGALKDGLLPPDNDLFQSGKGISDRFKEGHVMADYRGSESNGEEGSSESTDGHF